MKTNDTSHDEAPSHFRRTLLRVLTIQVVTLVLLWLLQARYAG